MEALRSSSIQQRGTSQGPENRFEALNYSELAASKRSEASSYKRNAYLCMAVGLVAFILIVGISATIGAGIATLASGNPITGAAIGGGFGFLLGLSIYNRVVKNKFFVEYRKAEEQALQQAQVYEGYVAATEKIQSNEDHPDWSPHQWHYAGQRNYWLERSQNAQTAIKEIDAEENPTEESEEKRHVLFEGDLLSSRIHAAFYQFKFENPDNEKHEEDFVKFQTWSQEDRDKYERQRRESLIHGRTLMQEPSYITLKSDPNIHFTRHQLATMSIDQLCAEIFIRQKAA